MSRKKKPLTEAETKMIASIWRERIDREVFSLIQQARKEEAKKYTEAMAKQWFE